MRLASMSIRAAAVLMGVGPVQCLRRLKARQKEAPSVRLLWRERAAKGCPWSVSVRALREIISGETELVLRLCKIESELAVLKRIVLPKSPK